MCIDCSVLHGSAVSGGEGRGDNQTIAFRVSGPGIVTLPSPTGAWLYLE